MLTKTKIAFAAATLLSLAGAPAAFASDNSGEYHGGFVMSGSMDGVNPAYHPEWFGSQARGSANAGGRGAFASAKRSKTVNRAKGRDAFGLAGEGGAAPYNGAFINGVFIPRGTSPAQVPAFREED